MTNSDSSTQGGWHILREPFERLSVTDRHMETSIGDRGNVARPDINSLLSSFRRPAGSFTRPGPATCSRAAARSISRSLFITATMLAGVVMTNSVHARSGTDKLADLVLTNADVYTGEAAAPRAQAIAVKGDRIVFVGSNEGAARFLPQARHVDLHGAFVMSGMIDAHTHPGTVSMLGTGDATKDAAARFPHSSKEEVLAYLRKYAADHPNEKVISLMGWPVDVFLPNGPHKRDLDAIWPTTPVLLIDNTGHSYWANSKMLELLGVTSDSKDLVPDVSVLIRDDKGEPTGWLKEFVVMSAMARYWLRPETEIRTRMKAYLDYLSSNGVTSVWDGGNYGLEDQVYKILSDMDKAGELPLRYFGSYHIWEPKQFGKAVGRIRQLQSNYGSKNLIIDTVKIHYDGISQLLTSGVEEPFTADPEKRGGVIASREQLSAFMIALDKARINIHLHTIGDRASNEALDAVEIARRKLGRPLRISVTLSHLEVMRPDNFPRFKALNVTANYTPMWFGRLYDKGLSYENLGAPRNQHRYQMGSMVRADANVSTGSDIIASGGIRGRTPLATVQLAATRKTVVDASDPSPPFQPNERVPLEKAIRAGTLGGAIQLGIEAETGTLKAGKLADIVILQRDPFKVPVAEVYKIPVSAVMMSGRLTSGTLYEADTRTIASPAE